MSIITRFLSAAVEPQFKLARDLTAMAIADGDVTAEKKLQLRVNILRESWDQEYLPLS